MIIEIDGYFYQALLQSSHNYSIRTLKVMYLELKNEIESITELPKAFCTRYNMTELIRTNETKPDIVIDTDTDRIYKPQYS